MSQDKLPPQGAEHTASSTARLQEQHDTLQRPELPSLALALAEVGMEEAPMRSLPPKEATAHPNPPSIHLLTGLVTGETTPEEEALWDEHYAGDPQAQARLAQLQQWTSSGTEAEAEAHQLQREQQALLQRGQRLLNGLPPLPQLQEFLEAAQPDETTAYEVMAPESNAATEAMLAHGESHPRGGVGEAPPVALGAPGPEECQEHQASPSPGWQSWLGWSMPMALAMGWLLIWQPPIDRTIPPMGSGIQAPGQRHRSVPIYRPAPAKAQPKGLDQRTAPPATRPPIVLKLLRKRGSQVQTMPPAFVVKDGDMARFVVKNASQARRYITLFLVEQSGAVSYLYPSRADGQQRLPSSRAGAFLKGGVALSAPTQPERIYGCVTSRPLSPARLKAFARRVKAGQQLRALARLPLPCVYQTSWLLKPASH